MIDLLDRMFEKSPFIAFVGALAILACIIVGIAYLIVDFPIFMATGAILFTFTIIALFLKLAYEEYK